MQSHLFPVRCAQGLGLAPHARGDSHPADVVQQAGPMYVAHLNRTHSPDLCGAPGEFGDSGRVPGQIRRDQVGEVRHSRQRRVDLRTAEQQVRQRLVGEYLRPA